MARYDQFTPGDRVSFTTYAPTLFGTFEGVVVSGVVDVRMANNYIDAHAMHANIYGSLPVGSAPNDPTKYSYVIVTLPDGQQTALGLPWIVEDSVSIVGQRTLTLDVLDVAEDDITEIIRVLRANGYTAVNPRWA